MRWLWIVSIVSLSFSAGRAAPQDMVIVGMEFMPNSGIGPDGKPSGAFVEMAKAMCIALKYQCQYRIVPRPRGIKMINSGRAQIFTGLASNPENDRVFKPVLNVVDVSYTFFVKKGNAKRLKTIEDLRGYNIAVLRGSTMNKDIVQRNEELGRAFTVVEETLLEAGLRKLAAGRYGEHAAFYGTRYVAAYQSQVEHLDVEPVSFDLAHVGIGVSIGKGVSDQEAAKIRNAVRTAMQQPHVKKIFTQYGMKLHRDIMNHGI